MQDITPPPQGRESHTLRFCLISLFVAAALLAPAIAEVADVRVPGLGLLSIPATGLGYMGVFFHELGHTVAHWAFGVPSIPTFDWQDGGGMTYGFGRSMFIQCLVWLCEAAGLWWLWRFGAHVLCLAGGALAAILFALSFSETARAMIGTYMGHGGEILVACFCIGRGLTNTVEGNKAIERWLNMIFGLFVLGRNALMNAVIFDEIGRSAYDMQKSGHVQGDLRTLADLAVTDIRHVAAFSFAFMAAALAATLALSWKIIRERE